MPIYSDRKGLCNPCPHTALTYIQVYFYFRATKNKNKHFVEVKAVLGKDYEVLSMEDIGIDVDVEENGTTFEENAAIKAEAICKICGKPVMADDSGLEIDYLDKKPGVLSARYLGHDTSYDSTKCLKISEIRA